MKKNQLINYCVIIVTLLTGAITFAAAEHVPVTVATLVDTSPGQNWPKVIAAAKTVYRSLDPGDKVLVFVVRGSKTTLHASMTRTPISQDYKDFCSIVDTVKDDWFASADITKALTGPVFQQLQHRTALKSPALVIVITEGKVSNQQATKICNFADDIRNKFQWSFAITGSVQNTNRRLLAASSQKRIKWCPLAEAVDSVFMREYIHQARLSASNNSFRSLSKTRASKPAKSEVLRKSAPLKIKDTPVTSPPVKKTLTVPKTKAGKPEEKSKKTVAKKLSTPPPKPAVQKRGSKETKPAPLKPKKSRLLSKTGILLLAIGAAFVISVISVLLIAGWIKTESWQKNIRKPLSTASQQENKPKILMASIGGVSYRLGNFQRFNSVRLGSSAENTIRIDNDAIAPRHLRIFRRGERLFVRNLAGDSVVINGQQLKKRRRTQITLPAVVTIVENVNLRLYLSKVNDLKKKNLEEPKNEQK